MNFIDKKIVFFSPSCFDWWKRLCKNNFSVNNTNTKFIFIENSEICIKIFLKKIYTKHFKMLITFELNYFFDNGPQCFAIVF